ncbi:hypothetical protein ACB092_01G401400 [Castanea dentata]
MILQSSFMAILLVIIITFFIGTCEGQLAFRFYAQTCPNAESIVLSVVQDAIARDPTMAAALLRLHFHDCFVEGCDGSILIDNGPASEKRAASHQGVKGFEEIEKAKAELESVCPGVVSCADIVALAARDAVALVNGPGYQVLTGRRDGRVSNLELAAAMPDVNDSIQLLKAKFLEKGLTEKDLVVLSAAHTIGTTACFFMNKRLYNFFPNVDEVSSDPSINPTFLPGLEARCPKDGDVNVRLAMDSGSEQLFDINILQNIRNGFAVLASDARLNDDETTKSVIDSYLSFPSPSSVQAFEVDFADSIVKMGRIGVKTGFQGEIRSVCSSFN